MELSSDKLPLIRLHESGYLLPYLHVLFEGGCPICMKCDYSTQVSLMYRSFELDRTEGKIIIFDTSKGLHGASISNWYGAMQTFTWSPIQYCYLLWFWPRYVYGLELTGGRDEVNAHYIYPKFFLRNRRGTTTSQKVESQGDCVLVILGSIRQLFFL